ncbi:MAG: acyl-CoA dehydrogenase family protein [Actinomycetota bacterium]
MAMTDSVDQALFRAEVAQWLAEHNVGDFAALDGRGGSGDETFGFEVRQAWELELAAGGWTCIGWPTSFGGRGASMDEQVIFAEEYARAKAPGRVSILGEGLLGPTLIHFGTPEQQARFLPPIIAGTELWCQGYSEPNAGSDLANVATKAHLDGDEWVISGQKVWTSLAHQSDWCFVVARTEVGSARHRGLSYLLVPMDQPGIEVRPIQQLTKTSEFNEVFFTEARTKADLVVGEPGQGWPVALATLSFERGVGLLGHLLGFRREFDAVVDRAVERGLTADPVWRQRLARTFVELEILRMNTIRSLTGVDGPAAPPEASISKLFWATWHRKLGELMMDVDGMSALVVGPEYDLDAFHRTFLFSRSETIYGGSNQIQRNIIGERVLGLPPEPKPLPLA